MTFKKLKTQKSSILSLKSPKNDKFSDLEKKYEI